MMSYLSQVWASIGTVAQGTWNELATQKAISAFNAFVSENLARWQMVKAPTQAMPADEASTALTVTNMTLTGGVGSVNISLTPSGSTSIAGFIICRSTAAITAPSWENAIAVIDADGTNAVTYVDSPLDAGTYHYRAAVFNTDGTLGAFIADDTAAAT